MEMNSWRMQSMCSDCPFQVKGHGLNLRRSLRSGRWREILSGLRSGRDFRCHKTTIDTGDGSELLCAGAIEWMNKRGLSSNYQRICERLQWFIQRKQE